MTLNKYQQKKFRIALADEQVVAAKNYARLMRLFPRWQEEDSYQFTVMTVATITVNVLSRDRYSSVFELIEQNGAQLLHKSCKLRVYHDAQLVDITQWNGERRFQARYDYPNKAMLARDEKWQLSRFLGEWLDHCIRHGQAITEVDLSY